MPRLVRGLLLAILSLASLPAIAGAHPGNPDFRSVIQGFSPQIPGLNIQVLNWDSDMQLSDPGHHTVVIYGYDHDQYARILPSGTVQVNQRSPAAYLNEDRYGTTPVPPSANAKDPPQWKTVNESNTFIWHDHRMHYMSPSTPPQVKDRNQRTKIFDYAIPMTVDGKPVTLDGTLFWVGPPNTSKTPFLIAGAGIVIALLVMVIWVRRRRGRADGGGGVAEPAKEATEAW
jgi:hypothetical protein